MKPNRSKTSRKRAFTLIELMIVVGIICILASLAVPQYIKYRDNARRGKCVGNLRAILEAKMAWHILRPDYGKTLSLSQLQGNNFFRGPNTNIMSCPGGGTYDLNWTVVTEPHLPPLCDYNGGTDHVLKARRAE